MTMSAKMSGLGSSREKEHSSKEKSFSLWREEVYTTIMYMYIHTVEPPKKGHIGMDHFVHYREVVLFQRQKCIATI